MAYGWYPELSGRDGPRYLALVEALADDIRTGRLAPGMQLPTHRELAARLGLNPGTVTRAYDEARRRGLVSSHVGRGTFVQERPRLPEQPALGNTSESINLRLNQPFIDLADETLNETLAHLSRQRHLAALLDYQEAPGLAHHRRAGAAWLGRMGLSVPESQIVITNGAQQALMAAISVTLKPGESFATEKLGYPGIRRLGELLRIGIVGLAMDADGLIPEALDEACKHARITALVCNPTIHNPTAISMPKKRREAIADVALRHGLTIIEDDIYGALPETPLPTFYALTQGRSLYVSGTSKAIAPGLRVGYVAAPEPLVPLLSGAIRATTWTTASLMAEIATLWINDGTAERFVARHRAETRRRQALAEEILGAAAGLFNPASYHMWLPLPHPWRGEDFVARAAAQGVELTPGAIFAMRGDEPVHAVRLSLGEPQTVAALHRGLEIVAALRASAPTSAFTVV